MDKNWSLKNKKDIDLVFSKGKSNLSGCILVKSIAATETKFLFAVSSKNFKRANQRNRIKRLMRVAASNIKDAVKNKHVAFIYVAKDIKSFEEINSSIVNWLTKK